MYNVASILRSSVCVFVLLNGKTTVVPFCKVQAVISHRLKPPVFNLEWKFVCLQFQGSMRSGKNSMVQCLACCFCDPKITISVCACVLACVCAYMCVFSNFEQEILFTLLNTGGLQ